MITIRNFGDLEIWKLGRKIVTDIYQLKAEFQKSGACKFVPQIGREAVLIPSNIAEGVNRFHNKEYRQCLCIVLGSCFELETQPEISSYLELINKEVKGGVIQKISHETGMLTNLIKRL